MTDRPTVALFTSDLRVRDNPAPAACRLSREVVPLFVLDDAILRGRCASPNRAAFLVEAQWIAGTGNDTRPNRMLNPVRQGRRFDPDGVYVRRWVPELASIDGCAVHEPWRLSGSDRLQLAYPPPLVDPAPHRT
ncbi:MAG: FAD-binding domain-containing protein [Actinopolymorphaceae bacterium]